MTRCAMSGCNHVTSMYCASRPTKSSPSSTPSYKQSEASHSNERKTSKNTNHAHLFLPAPRGEVGPPKAESEGSSEQHMHLQTCQISRKPKLTPLSLPAPSRGGGLGRSPRSEGSSEQHMHLQTCQINSKPKLTPLSLPAPSRGGGLGRSPRSEGSSEQHMHLQTCQINSKPKLTPLSLPAPRGEVGLGEAQGRRGLKSNAHKPRHPSVTLRVPPPRGARGGTRGLPLPPPVFEGNLHL